MFKPAAPRHWHFERHRGNVIVAGILLFVLFVCTFWRRPEVESRRFVEPFVDAVTYAVVFYHWHSGKARGHGKANFRSSD
jgi:hypothetical protein